MRLIATKFVSPFVKSNKTDAADVTYVVQHLPTGTYYFAVTAYNLDIGMPAA